MGDLMRTALAAVVASLLGAGMAAAQPAEPAAAANAPAEDPVSSDRQVIPSLSGPDDSGTPDPSRTVDAVAWSAVAAAQALEDAASSGEPMDAESFGRDATAVEPPAQITAVPEDTASSEAGAEADPPEGREAIVQSAVDETPAVDDDPEISDAPLDAGQFGTAAAAEEAADPEQLPAAVSQVAAWAIGAQDARGLPFVVIDKVAAKVFVFDPAGQLVGVTPALLGIAHGDDSTPDIGSRPLSAIRPEERTTPAGRFVAGYGLARRGSRIFWVDYATALSLHPVVTTNPKEQRAKRLRSRSPVDNRITYGCINVAAGFYNRVVRPTFDDTPGVVYILPETRSLDEVFPSLHAYNLTHPVEARVVQTVQTADDAGQAVVSVSDDPSPQR